jgi:hypothetical protein
MTGVLTLLVGLGAACYGMVRWRQIRELHRTGVRSVGTVVGHERHPKGGASYATVVAFVDAAGHTRRCTADFWVNWRLHRVGKKIPVRYPPGRPYAAQLGSTTYYALAAGAPLGVGVLFVVFGLLALFDG